LTLAMDDYAQKLLGGDMARLTLTQLELQRYQAATALLAPLGVDLVEAARYYARTFAGHKRVLGDAGVKLHAGVHARR
jgi:CYTH domain-containing protein